MRIGGPCARLMAAALAAALAGVPAQAADTTAAFLKVGVGARPLGMGNAFAAVSDDINAAHWNPAGLSQLRRRELGAMDAQLFADTRLDFLGYAHPVGRGTLAFSTVFLTQGAIEERGANREKLGTFTASDAAFGVSYARRLGAGVGLGGTLKGIQSRIADESASTWAVDLGLLWRSPIDGASLGLSVQNLGPGMRFIADESKLPLTGAVGAAWRLPMGLTFAADYRRQVYDRRSSFSAGTEYPVMRSLVLRAGYLTGLGSAGSGGGRFEDYKGVGAGLGLKVFGMSLDYALTPMGELGSAQRISLGARF